MEEVKNGMPNVTLEAKPVLVEKSQAVKVEQVKAVAVEKVPEVKAAPAQKAPEVKATPEVKTTPAQKAQELKAAPAQQETKSALTKTAVKAAPQLNQFLKPTPQAPEPINNLSSFIGNSISKPVQIENQNPVEVQIIKPEAKAAPIEQPVATPAAIAKPEAKPAPIEQPVATPAPIEQPVASPALVEATKLAPVEEQAKAIFSPIINPTISSDLPIVSLPQQVPEQEPQAPITIPFPEEVAEKALYSIEVFNPKEP